MRASGGLLPSRIVRRRQELCPDLPSTPAKASDRMVYDFHPIRPAANRERLRHRLANLKSSNTPPVVMLPTANQRHALHYGTGGTLESPPDRPTIAGSTSSRDVDEIRKSTNPGAPGDATLSNCMSSI